MRILLVANTLPPDDISGVGEQVLQLAAGLTERGHEVEVLGRGTSGAAGPKLLFPLTVTAPLVRRLRRFRPDVVQVHESDGALAALVTAVVGGLLSPAPTLVALMQVSYREERRAVRPIASDGRILGRPAAVERRFRWLKAPLQIALGCLTVWLADLVLAPSRTTAAEVERDYGVSGVGTLYNVTGGREHQRGEEATTARIDDPLLFVGRLRLRKGVEVLLYAMAAMTTGATGSKLVIAGDGEHRKPLERLTARLGLEDRVVFLGRQSAAEVRALMKAARALVVPSLYEGMPLVILEAMDLGLPVVASAVSGIPEVVVDGETGWLVPPEDIDALTAALDQVVADDGEAARRGASGRRRVDERFRPAHAAETWEKLLREHQT